MSIDKVRYLYHEQGLSARETGEKLGITTWQVIRLMRKYNLERRTPAETQRIQYHKRPTSFYKREQMLEKERGLYEAGLMLYWCEGVKASPSTVDLANSNERMISIFLVMLRTIYRVTESRLRVLLYCYANQDAYKLIKYWSKLLGIPESQFIKPYIRQDFDRKKVNKMPYGLVHVRYNDKKLFMQIQKDIDIISSKLIQG